MLKTLKISHPEHDIWFLGCGHWHHDRDFIWRPRGFTSVVEHDNALVVGWNAVCSPNSVCFLLGDTMFNSKAEDFWALMRRLRFRTLYHLWGNHHSGVRDAYKQVLQATHPGAVAPTDELLYEVYPLSANVDGDPARQVVFLPTYVEASIGGHAYTLCHFPIVSHHGIGKGATHLTSHCHGKLPLTNAKTGQGRRLDVGPESIGAAPWSLQQIKRHLVSRNLDVPDHHGRKEAL